MASVKVTFWGTRGTVPVPGPGTLRYGGNTPCVSVEAGTGRVILDAGTGLRVLGEALERAGDPAPLAILLSHTHWDHLNGLPFLPALYQPSGRVVVRGPAPEMGRLEDVLRRLLDPAFFPVPLTAVADALTVIETDAGPFECGGFAVRTTRLRHPGGALGYALTPTGGGPTVTYITDNELPGPEDAGLAQWRDNLVRFLRGSDLLIHDATYDDATVAARPGWGHSSPSQAVDLAVAAECRRLVLFHHAPEHDDDTMDRLLDAARTRAGGALEVEAAREDMILTL